MIYVGPIIFVPDMPSNTSMNLRAFCDMYADFDADEPGPGIAEDAKELHAFAERIGVVRTEGNYIDNEKQKGRFYIIDRASRTKAVADGAIQHTAEQRASWNPKRPAPES